MVIILRVLKEQRVLLKNQNYKTDFFSRNQFPFSAFYISVRKIFFLFFVLASLNSSAQLVFVQTKQNVGDIDVHNQLSIPFIVKNTGDRKEFVLKVEPPSGVTYQKPLHAIIPDGTDTLKIFFAPTQKGIFEKEKIGRAHV